MRAVVTGAARGIGEAIAEHLHAASWDVLLVDVDPDVVAAADRLRASRAGSSTLGVVADVSDADADRRAIDVAVQHMGGIDLVVNNAGIGGPGLPLENTSAEDLRRVLEVNLLGPLLLLRCAIPHLRVAGGSIINIGSLFGEQPVANDSSYCASKGGITAITRALARELGPDVRVNAISPGLMDTAMHWQVVQAQATDAGCTFEMIAEQERRRIPLERHGTVEDVAKAVMWLASPDASYVTGQVIGVDGGAVV